jgi:hypothetical protein
LIEVTQGLRGVRIEQGSHGTPWLFGECAVLEVLKQQHAVCPLMLVQFRDQFSSGAGERDEPV